MSNDQFAKERTHDSVSRRNFLNTSILVTGGAIVSLSVIGCAAKVPGAETSAAPSGPTYRLTLADAPELQQVGGVKQVKSEGFDFFVVRESDSKYIALNNICTHEACPMKYQKTSSQIVCPCHQSVFDLKGQPLRGPAKLPLTQFSVMKDGDALVIALSQ